MFSAPGLAPGERLISQVTGSSFEELRAEHVSRSRSSSPAASLELDTVGQELHSAASLEGMAEISRLARLDATVPGLSRGADSTDATKEDTDGTMLVEELAGGRSQPSTAETQRDFVPAGSSGAL